MVGWIFRQFHCSGRNPQKSPPSAFQFDIFCQNTFSFQNKQYTETLIWWIVKGPENLVRFFGYNCKLGVFNTGTANNGPKNLYVVSSRGLRRVPLYRSSCVLGDLSSHCGHFFRTLDGPYKIVQVSRFFVGSTSHSHGHSILLKVVSNWPQGHTLAPPKS